MFSILKKEIISYLSSLVAYVTIGVFLVVLGLFLWVVPSSSILDYGYAGLDSLFSTAPYLFLFLIPAITMRSMAEERREGTFELLLTRPLTDWQIILGKYLAGVILVLFALIPTLVYYYSVWALGNPQGNIDTGAVIGSYIGLFLLGACFTAIGLFASSISKNQIIAFTIAAFLCAFFYIGLDLIGQLQFLQNFSLEDFGINEHYQSVSRGVLDTRDLVYFLILSAIFIWLALFAMLRQRQKSVFNKTTIGIVAGIILLAIISLLTFTRIDFTREGRFTISPVSRQIMQGFDKDVKVTIYFKGENFQPWMKHLQRDTRDKLSDLQAYTHGRLKFEFIDPTEGIKNLSEDQQHAVFDSLEAKGIVPQSFPIKTDNGIGQMLIFPEALVQYGDKHITVNLLQSHGLNDEDEAEKDAAENLEYAFASAIKKVTSGGKAIVAFTEGHNELSDIQLWGAMKSLADGYNVGRINLNNIPFDSLLNIKLLIIPKPDKAFNEIEKFKIDQYIMRGGKVVWALDQVSAELDSMRGHGNEEMSFPKQLNLDDQLFVYGARINYDLIADYICAQIPVAAGNAGGQPQIQLLPWLLYPVIIPDTIHPIVKNLEGIRLEFASTIDTLAVKNVKKTVILATSPNNTSLHVPKMITLNALEQEPDPNKFKSTPKTVGLLLDGKFQSDWLNRPLPEGLTDKVDIVNESKPTKMIVISDGDVFKNQVAADGSPYPLGYDEYTRQTFGNKDLLLNIADYMTDDPQLIGLRTKIIQKRLLNRAIIRDEKLKWQLINTIVPLGIVLIFAIFQHYIRKRKYAH